MSDSVPETRLVQSPLVPAVLGGIVAVLGIVLGLVGPTLARGLAALIERTPFPVHAVIDILATMSRAWSLGVLVPLGIVGGLALAYATVQDALRLTVHDNHLEYQRGSRSGWVDRSDVSAVFRDTKYLVILDERGGVRARLDAEALSAAKLSTALVRHGYPWTDEDPYEADFQDWVDGRPGLTAAEHTLLRRRHGEQKPGPAQERAEEDLADAGLVVRERRGRLQVRRVESHGPSR